MELKKDIANKIKNARLAVGLTQRQLAEKLDYSPQAISNIERGDRSLGVEVLEKIANALNCDINIILKGRGK